MKTEPEQQKKWGTSVLLATILLTVLSLARPAISAVTLAGSWVTGTTHAKENGSNRALIFIAHGELTNSMNLSAVTYGGQLMTKVIDRNYYSGSGSYAYAAAYILNEAGVAAATGSTFSLTWSATPSEVKYASVFLENVNQTTLAGASASGGGTTNPVTTSALATSSGDMVIDAATCGNTGTYTLNGSFTQGTNQSSGSSTGVTGYKSATGASETPSASHSNISGNRQTIIGFVVQGTASDPNKATNPNPANGATSVAVTTNLSWTAGAGVTSSDVYFGTDPNARNNSKTTVSTNSFDPSGNLLYGTTYYWAVDSNNNGTIYPGDNWNFTTIGNKVSNPNPASGATNVAVTTSLSWTAAISATSYDVYFGTNSNARNNPKTTVYTNSYDPPGNLAEETTYYWVVDTNDADTIYPGDQWNFTTFTPVQAGDRVIGNMMLINDNGGFCWYQDDKVVYDPTGHNILASTAASGQGFGGVGGNRKDDVDATTFNIDTGKRTRVLAHDFGNSDDHNMGAFWIRPDGKYLHVYCQHYNNQVTYYRLANNPNDGSSWGAEQTYNWLTIPGSPGSDTLTSSYTNVHYISGEGTGNGRLYNIIRIFERTPCVSYSDDWGQTWQYMGRLNGIVGTTTYSNFYHKFRSNGVDRIDFIGCEQHPRNYTNSIYHGYIKGGKSYNSFGVEIDTINDQTAPTIQAFTPVWLTGSVAAGQYHTGWTNEMELDSDGRPVCLFQTRYGTSSYGGNTGAGDHRFFYGRFDGSAWHYTELAKMGTGLHTPEQDYIGMGCIHPDDANVIYISTPFDPRNDLQLDHHEIFKGLTSDRGATWNWTQITFDSTIDNIRPAIPKWDANNTAVVWQRGVYPGQENYDMVIVGMVQRENETLGLVDYFDANQSNTTNADDSAFSPTGPSGSAGAADSRWHAYTAYGNAGSCYTAGDSGTENAPAIKTTITGLTDGTYDVFAYFWCDPTADWGVRGGFSNTESDLLCFNKQSSQYAEASGFSGSVETVGATTVLYRVYIGRKVVSEGNSVVVYIDNYDSSFSNNVPTRTTYDGVGVAKVMMTGSIIPGDLDGNGRIDFQDVAVLGRGWQMTYDINTLADIVENWLEGTY